MLIGVLKENRIGEKRVSVVPKTVLAYQNDGMSVCVEENAGVSAGFSDHSYRDAGAETCSRHRVLERADILISIFGPTEEDLPFIRAGTVCMADFETFRHPQRFLALAHRRTTILALERMPRISRAQGADILSSQGSLDGYKAGVTAMNALSRVIPMMTTSAGTVSPVRALVIGAGVTGLQALAVLKRSGARVFVFDIRAESREQVESLGGQFWMPESDRPFDDIDFWRDRLADIHILVSAAVTGGRKVPVTVTQRMLDFLPDNAVVIDTAGTNVAEGAGRANLILIRNEHFASEIPYTASLFFSENVYRLIELCGGARFAPNWDDEILSAICVCRDGQLTEIEE